MKLKECCDFIDYRGKTPEKSDFGYRFITAKNVGIDGFHDEPMEFIPKENYENVMVRGIPEEGNILFTTEAPMGHVGMIPHFEEPFAVGQRLIVIQPNKELLVPKYLMYLLRSRKFQDKVTGRSSGSTVTGIRSKELIEISISFPDIESQKIVSDILDLLEEIIKNRVKELRLLDDLIKARFVEMFGNPFDNEKWSISELKDISESMIDGSNVDPKYYESEGDVLFLRIQNVWRNEFRLDDSVYISQEINRENYNDTSLHTGDLLITKIGRYYTKDSSLGRVSIYRGMDDCANYSNNIMRVRLRDSMNSEFVNVLLNLDDYQSFIKRTSKGGTDKRALSKTLIGSYPIITPPKAMQDEFVSFVKQVDKSKVAVQKSLDGTQILFDSLMQEYFG